MKKDINKCLLKRGFKLERTNIPEMKLPKIKTPRVEIKEFDNIQKALKKLRRLRGL